MKKTKASASAGRPPRRLIRVKTIERVWWRTGSGNFLQSEEESINYRLAEFRDGCWRRVRHV